MNVFGWFTDFLSGDWEAVWKFGDALINAAECMQDLGINIQQGAVDLDGSWDGNAADAAYMYFSGLAAAVSGQQTALREIGNNYHDAARGAWQLGNQLGNILQALVDKAIIAGVAYVAGRATARTIVGGVAGQAIATMRSGRSAGRPRSGSDDRATRPGSPPEGKPGTAQLRCSRAGTRGDGSRGAQRRDDVTAGGTQLRLCHVADRSHEPDGEWNAELSDAERRKLHDEATEYVDGAEQTDNR